MDAEAKLTRLLDNPEQMTDPLVESLLDAISWLDANWDLSRAPMMDATRSILAAVLIDYGLAFLDEDPCEFNEFEQRFVAAFEIFQKRLQSAVRGK